jgi:ankyrin repeat protein
MSPLMHAAKNGKTAIAQLLLQEGAEKEAKNKFEKTALLIAAEKGDAATAQVLLQAGANKEARELSKKTPLITAAGTKRFTATVQLLLQAGAEKDARDNRNCSSLHWACDNNCIDTVKVLLEAGVDVHAKNDDLKTPLDKAREYNYPEIVALLEVAMSGPAAVPAIPPPQPPGDIFVLCQEGNERDVQACIAADETLIHARDPKNFNRSPLHVAVQCGKTVTVQLLLEAGADKEAKDKFNLTPLLIAAKSGLANISQILLQAGADKDAKDNSQKTPMHLAVNMGNISTVQVLVEAGADVHAKDKDGKIPLDISRERAALYPGSGHEEIVALLETLTVASESTPVSTADVQSSTEAPVASGSTPVDAASGEDIFVRISKGNEQGVQELIAADNTVVNSKGPCGMTPLHYAIAYNQGAIAKLLLKAGADPHTKCDDGNTSLAYAQMMSLTEIVELVEAMNL